VILFGLVTQIIPPMLANKSGVNRNYVLEIQEAPTNSKAAEEKTGKGTYKQLTKTI